MPEEKGGVVYAAAADQKYEEIPQKYRRAICFRILAEIFKEK